MRMRERKRIEKRARRSVHEELRDATPEGLTQIARERAHGHFVRAEAIKLLAPKRTPAFLLEEFYGTEEKIPLWETALVLEIAGGADIIEPLIAALHDANPDRRHAAARALGWNSHSGGMHPRRHQRLDPRAVAALEALLGDQAEPPGNWYPIGKEALSRLANSIPKYREMEAQEKERIVNDPNASTSDRRWAKLIG